MEILFGAKYIFISNTFIFSGINRLMALAPLPPGRYL